MTVIVRHTPTSLSVSWPDISAAPVTARMRDAQLVQGEVELEDGSTVSGPTVTVEMVPQGADSLPQTAE